MRSLFLLLILASPVLAQARQAAAPCESLDACIAQMKERAGRADKRPTTLSLDEQALLKRMLIFDGAVPALVEMLADPDERLADLAAKGLRDAESIDPIYLDAVKAGLDRGLDWLPPALGRMADDEAAAEAVARFLVSESAPENQEAYAVELSGGRAIPYIVDAARCSKACGERDHYYLAHVLAEMKPHRALAAPGLMSIAEDDTSSEQVAGGALRMIAALQADGFPLESRLLALRARKPLLIADVDEALVGIGSTQAGATFARRLRDAPDISLLRDLAKTGVAGNSAGPALLELLNHPDWDIRIGAARAIGYVEYAAGADALVPLLEEPGDVRLNWVAAQSLGSLRAPKATTALQRVAQTHWFPPVRDAARQALSGVGPSDGRSAEGERSDFTFAVAFYEYQATANELAACKKTAISVLREPRESKLRIDNDAEQLAKMGYAATVLSYGEAEPVPQGAGAPKVIELTPNNIVEHRSTVSQVPSVALRVDGGWLAGSDRGEWGGELVFLGDDGVNQTILDENIKDIYRLGPRIVVVTGLAHLMMSKGMLYEITRSDVGKWKARRWRSLPGAPRTSGLVSSGELLVSTSNRVPILVSSDGAMRMAPCAAYEKAR